MLTTRVAWERFVPQLNGEISKIFNENARNRAMNDVGLNKVFKTIIDTNYANVYTQIATMGGARRVAEGQDFPKTTMSPGYSNTALQKHYANSFEITKDHRIFIANKWNEVKALPKNLVNDAYDKIDQSLAEVLNNGQSTSYTDVYGDVVSNTTGDGVALFSASHKVSSSSAVFSNIIYSGTNNPAFSETAVTAARTQGATFTNSSGQLAPIMFDTLIVSTSVAPAAYKLVNSEQVVGSAYNDANPYYKAFDVIEWPRLTSGSWYLANRAMLDDAFFVGFAQKPELDMPEEMPRNKNWLYTLDFYYYIQRGNPMGIFQSLGTGS